MPGFRLSLLFIIIISQLLQGCAHLPTKPWRIPKVYRQTWVLGDTPIVIQREDYGPGIIFVHVHANETTALEAARLVARTQGGQVITLVHAKTRQVDFTFHGLACAFDPNRIYSSKGIANTLKQYHCDSPGTRAVVEGFAKQIIASIPQGKIVAVHNNNGYSLKSYLNDPHFKQDFSDIYYDPKILYRNFFLVTQASDFNRYKNMGFNVVLQSSHVFDDGSMSVYYKHRQYANSEAGYNQLLSQIRMLQHA
jgi:hypothetical protein